MITDPTARVGLSTLGWVDHGSLTRFRGTSDQVDAVSLSDADYLAQHLGRDGYFAVQHNWGASRFRVTAHRFEDPERAIASVDVDGWTARSSGNAAVWSSLPHAYVGVLDDDATGAAGYFTAQIAGGEVEVARLDWFDDDSFDHGYQGVVSVAEPRAGVLVYGVQRSSELVVCDADSQRVSQKVPLAGRSGNPRPLLSRSTGRMWVIDCDTLVRLDRSSFRLEETAQLQPAPDRTAMFVGEPWLADDEKTLIVARPFSGDVAVVDADSLKITSTVALGAQPIEAARLGDHLIARDWKTGAVLGARLPTQGRRRRWIRSRW
jgi:hypothetical protein